MTTAQGSDNPYVGPRAFSEGEALPGRDKETRGLVGKLLGERILLLHSPSGAGKSSLIQAAVAPEMAKAGFHLCARIDPELSGLRVGLPPGELEVGNRYTFSLVMDLLPGRDPAQLANMTITRALDVVDDESSGAPMYRLLILDQLEEVLVMDPTDDDAKLEFFTQLGEALDAPHRWALLSIREDYMGGLDRYTRYLPTELRTRYRLNFLERDAALQAIRGPAAARGVTITEQAALTLFDDLRKVRRQGSLNAAETVQGPYVEPVQLQVVCHRLWRRLHEKKSLARIGADDIKPYRDVEGALGAFYADAIREVAVTNGVAEPVLRDWFENELVDERGLRRQTPLGPDTGDPELTAQVLNRLEHRYLVRGDRRAGTTWWELTHDRLIEPLLTNNRKHLTKTQLLAREWQRKGRDPAFLLTGDQLRTARHALAARSEDQTASERLEREFIDTSAAAQKTALFRQRVSNAVAVLALLVLLEAVVIVALALG